ncbi:alpha-amylase family glycosyl hydrolase, partial [Dermatophilus congolensis]
MANPTSPSPYERMGGHAAFTTLISTFYDGVRNDPELRALYPEEDLAPAEQRLLEFMEQYWGGPTTYSEKRGHPRLRMRHMPFAITPSQRDRWVTHMMKGVDAMGLPQPEDTALRAYLLRAADSLINTPEPQPLPWWKNAVVYQIYPRSFADANGDGIGDFPGITNNLHHIAELGVDAIWISPFYPSPMADAGYDVTDYRDIDPTYGTLEDLDNLINRAHQLGLKIIIDIVPNHTSSSHPWFQQALNAAPNSPERDRYIFRQGRGPNGELPPNNWESNFSGPAWTRTDDGSWYLHLFDSAQPDLNWNNPHVHAEFESILRYWCDRGIDGFRIDVAHGLIKADGLPDTDP